VTREEWNRRESYYQDKISRIRIVSEINEQMFKDVIAQIDETLSEAQFDYSRAKSAYQQMETVEKVTIKEYFVSFKEEGNSDKLSEALAVRKANSENVYSRTNEARRRYNFMQAVIDLLRDKREMLITDAAILKIETSLLK
jgi:hypothetical protein